MVMGAFLSACISGFLMGCASMKEVNLDEVPDSLSLDIKKKEKIKIYAKENITTGYVWNIALDSTSIKLLSNDYKSDNKVPVGLFVGAGGTRIYVIEAQKEGLSTIVLSWGRGWMPEPDKVKKVALNVQ